MRGRITLSSRIFFYLPAVTPWWFDNIVAPLALKLGGEHEVHIAVAPFDERSRLGIHSEQLQPFADADHVHWHILEDGGDDPALAHAIAPDYVLCRTADLDAARAFPGTVRLIMEAAAPPMPLDNGAVILHDALFDHGCFPTIGPAEQAQLDDRFGSAWARLKAKVSADITDESRADYCARAGIPADRILLALPLEYEHRENVFAQHRAFERNADLVRHLLATLDEDCFLALSNHPLNDRHVNNRRLERLVARNADRVALVTAVSPAANATDLLLRHADGVVIENSKVISLAAFHGKPIARLAPFPTGAWMNAYPSVSALVAALRAGNACAAAEADTRRWFGYHVANSLILARNEDITASDLIDRIEWPCDPGRWDRGFARYQAHRPELFQ